MSLSTSTGSLQLIYETLQTQILSEQAALRTIKSSSQEKSHLVLTADLHHMLMFLRIHKRFIDFTTSVRLRFSSLLVA